MSKIYIGNKLAVECNNSELQNYVKTYYAMMLKGTIEKQEIKIKTSTKSFIIEESQWYKQVKEIQKEKDENHGEILL